MPRLHAFRPASRACAHKPGEGVAARKRLAPLVAVASLTLTFAAPAPVRAAEVKPAAAGVIPIGPLFANLQRSRRLRGVLSVEAELDVADAPLRSRVMLSMPRLRDAYMRYMFVYACAMPRDAAPDPERIGSELQRLTDRVLGKAGARVLVGSMTTD